MLYWSLCTNCRSNRPWPIRCRLQLAPDAGKFQCRILLVMTKTTCDHQNCCILGRCILLNLAKRWSMWFLREGGCMCDYQHNLPQAPNNQLGGTEAAQLCIIQLPTHSLMYTWLGCYFVSSLLSLPLVLTTHHHRSTLPPSALCKSLTTSGWETIAA